jgi:hypothetical protein
MIEFDSDTRALQTMHPGQRVEVWDGEVLRCRGLVEEHVPQLGVVWIREAGIGERKMITTTGCSFRSY